MRRSLTAVAAGAVSLLLLAACGGGTADTGTGDGGSGAEDGGTDSVTVGVIPIVDVAPIYLGVEQGFFEERGIELTLESGQGGAAIVPAVVSGQFQFGFSNVTSLLLARSQGLPLKIVAAGNYSTGEDGADFSAIVVPEGSDITDASGLAGRTVSVNTLQNIGDTTVRQSVEKAGGDPDAVEFVELAFPDMPAALAEGNVDAAWLVEPFLTIAKQAGAQEIASNLVDTAPELMIAAYFSSEELLESDPDLVERFTEALNESLEYAEANPETVREIILTYTQIEPGVAEEMTLPRWSSDISEDTLQLLAELALEDGLVDEAVLKSQLREQLQGVLADVAGPPRQRHLLCHARLDLRISEDDLPHGLRVRLGVLQRLVQRLGEPFDEVGVGLQELLGGEVGGDHQLGGGVHQVGGDLLRARLLGDRQERLDQPRRVDVPLRQRGRHVGERQLDELDGVGVAPGLLHRLAHGRVPDVLQRVHGHGPARQAGGVGDVAAFRHDDRAEVGAVLPGGVVAGGDDLQGQPLRARQQQRGDVAEPELELSADHRGNDGGAALTALERQLDAALFEEALLHAEVDRGDVDDRDHTDGHAVRAAVLRATATVAGSGVRGAPAARGEEQ